MSFYEKSREFAVAHILPFAKEIDEKATFPVESFKEMGKHGFLKLVIPKEYGGLGGTIKDHADAVRAFASTCATAGLCYMMHNVATMCVLNYGSKELKDKVFKDVVEKGKFLALAYSEFGTGTHFYLPEIKVEFKDGKATFNGKKSMVTSATHASYYALLTPSKGEGIDNWLFPLDSGIKFESNNWNGLGMRGNVSAPMAVDNVTLDETYRIGESGTGATQVFETVAPFFILGLAAVYTGLAQSVRDFTIERTTSRVYPNGQSLANIETVQIHLSKIYADTAACIALTQSAAEAALNGDADALAKILSARIKASESAIELASIAMRIGGGKAYNKDGAIERLLRDSYAGQVMAPSVDVLKVWLGKAITGQQIP